MSTTSTSSTVDLCTGSDQAGIMADQLLSAAQKAAPAQNGILEGHQGPQIHQMRLRRGKAGHRPSMRTLRQGHVEAPPAAQGSNFYSGKQGVSYGNKENTQGRGPAHSSTKKNYMSKHAACQALNSRAQSTPRRGSFNPQLLGAVPPSIVFVFRRTIKLCELGQWRCRFCKHKCLRPTSVR